jgi:hypothetical protein
MAVGRVRGKLNGFALGRLGGVENEVALVQRGG